MHECKLKMVIKNVLRTPWKKPTFYPECERSKEFIKLLWDPRQKRPRLSFTKDELRQMKKIGFDIEIIGEPYEKFD